MFRILFLSSGNSGRSLIAGTFARTILPDNVEVTIAVDRDNALDPTALDVLREINPGLPSRTNKLLKDVSTVPFDLVVTLCEKKEMDKGTCLDFPGSPALIQWQLPDPLKLPVNDRSLKDNIRWVRDEILHKVKHFVDDGYFQALRKQRILFGSLIENLVDGVIAHDIKRRIIYINRAAQRITGYSFADVIGQDCHEVFPGRFCGGTCAYCEDPAQYDRIKYHTTIMRKDGTIRDLEMSSIAIAASQDEIPSTLIIFKDLSKNGKVKRSFPAKSMSFQGIVSDNPLMDNVFDTIREIANINVPVLVQGESGTGKEMVANAIHNLSARCKQPFVPVNCGALPEGTLNSELFGHVKGAFTDAIRDMKGRFELADGGTIFLDEIAEISTAMQVKLLRVLQEKTFTPVGGEQDITVDVRIICATNKDLKRLVRENQFRDDLFYRLAVVPVDLPALREKSNDIPLLIDYFLRKYSSETGKSVDSFSPEALLKMMDYNWPGNIRELSNTVQYALIKCHEKIIGLKHLPVEIRDFSDKPGRPGRRPKLHPDDVYEIMKKTNGNKSQAAKLLGVSRPTLYSYIEKQKA